MADEPKRIIDLTEVSSVAAGDYIAMDSEDGGTKKIPASHFTGGSGQVMWGGIQGDISQQADLNGYLEQLPIKADIDGYYEDMSVGSAEQLLSNTYEPDSTPYLYRTSGGSIEIGNRVYEDAIVGGSVAWNQLLAPQSITVDNEDFSISSDNGKYTVTVKHDGVTLPTTSYKYISGTFYANHVYLLTDNSPQLNFYFVNSLGTHQNRNMYKPSSNLSWGNFRIVGETTLNAGAYKITPQVFDLTQMFGSTIADYAYTLETSEVGSGIAWLKSQGFFTKNYYAYNAGSIKSVQTSAKKVVGFNAYDNATGKAKLVGGHEYQITGAYTALSYSTGETITPDANGKFTPTDNGELTVTGGNGTTTCVHLHWDGERDGEYEAYEEHTYPLDSDLELRGIPKLDSANKLYYDGDTYESDGSVTRNWVLRVLNGQNIPWTVLSATSGLKLFYLSTTNWPVYIGPIPKRTNLNEYPDVVCDKFITQKRTNSTHTSIDAVGIYGWVDGSIALMFAVDSSVATTGAEFNTWLASNPTTIVYKASTPTTESADPYTNPQLVDNWGTEEFVDTRDVPVPVGHESRYLPDLKAKLESAPNNPSTNGKYFLQYENGEATYVPVPSEVPQTPSEDGTYVLKATVASGTATLSWVTEE